MLLKLDPTPRLLDGASNAHLFETCSLSTEISVVGLEVMADIGIYDHEVGAPQPLRLNVRLQVAAVEHDQIDEAFDYAKVVTIAQRLATERTALIETFARRMATACLCSPMVLAADVEIEKPRALPGCLAGARVKLQRAVAA